MTIKQKARLENWSITSDPRQAVDAYMAPECIRMTLNGSVYEHPRFADGEFIITSAIVDADFKAKWVQTGNTLYTLGTPNPSWLEWCKEHGTDLGKFGLDEIPLKKEQ